MYPAARVPFFLRLHSWWKTLQMIDNDSRLKNECKDTEDGWVLNRGMKDGSTKVKGEDLHANTNATHFARWPGMNGIGKEQHDTIVCMTLRHNLSHQPATFHMLCVRHVLRMCIPSTHIHMHSTWYNHSYRVSSIKRHSYYLFHCWFCVATIQGQLLFEGGIYFIGKSGDINNG